jgi:ribosome-associated protein
MQFIGKLMRDIDAQPIIDALEAMHRPARQKNQVFHELEALREEVLAAGAPGVELVMKRWPEADRQQLRQLILQHQREQQRNKPPAANRRLFRYLRELQEFYGEAD